MQGRDGVPLRLLLLLLLLALAGLGRCRGRGRSRLALWIDRAQVETLTGECRPFSFFLFLCVYALALTRCVLFLD